MRFLKILFVLILTWSFSLMNAQEEADLSQRSELSWGEIQIEAKCSRRGGRWIRKNFQ